MVDKPTIMGLHASDELAFERDFRAQAEQHAINAEARASIAEEKLDVALGQVDELHADIAYWTKRAKDAEARADTWFSIGLGAAIAVTGALFAWLVVSAWRAAQ